MHRFRLAAVSLLALALVLPGDYAQAADPVAEIHVAPNGNDANPGTPGRYGVRAIPTLLAFKGGEVTQQLQGARPRSDLEDMVKNLL